MDRQYRILRGDDRVRVDDEMSLHYDDDEWYGITKDSVALFKRADDYQIVRFRRAVENKRVG